MQRLAKRHRFRGARPRGPGPPAQPGEPIRATARQISTILRPLTWTHAKAAVTVTARVLARPHWALHGFPPGSDSAEWIVPVSMAAMAPARSARCGRWRPPRASSSASRPRTCSGSSTTSWPARLPPRRQRRRHRLCLQSAQPPALPPHRRRLRDAGGAGHGAGDRHATGYRRATRDRHAGGARGYRPLQPGRSKNT